MSLPSTSPSTSRPKSRWAALALAGIAAAGLATAGAVHAHWDRGGWRAGPGEGRLGDRFERQARLQRFCHNDTARYHPVLRAFVRADLRLDQAQAAEFEKLAGLVLPGLEELKAEVCNDFTVRGGPAPERMAHLAGVLRKAADMAEKAVQPSRDFYDSLNAEQKQRVDELTDRRRRFGGR
jgi:hypothetical protein